MQTATRSLVYALFSVALLATTLAGNADAQYPNNWRATPRGAVVPASTLVLHNSDHFNEFPRVFQHLWNDNRLLT
jgi:hypothetical protein